MIFQRAIRQIYVYRKTPTTMDQLKAGDYFSMDMASEEDGQFINPDTLFQVSQEPEIEERTGPGVPPGSFGIPAIRLKRDDSFEGLTQ